MLVNHHRRSLSLNPQLPLLDSSSSSSDFKNADLIFRHRSFSIVGTLCQSNYPVLLVSSSKSRKLYVMKIFPWENGAQASSYKKEARFAQFTHPNIITIPSFQDKERFTYNRHRSTISYILMEYAKYGDFLTACTKHKIPFHDKLLRTYFHQLMSALEYLHSKGAAHLDIKPENLLIGEDYKLKVADFDLSYMPEDGEVRTRGTKNFRAPELFNFNCKDPQASDIYSAGIVLFFLKTKGILPYSEEPTDAVDLAIIKQDDPEMFWKMHIDYGEMHPSFFSEDFKNLFLSMTKFDPNERMTLWQVKESNWYKGDVYSGEELAEFMKGRFSKEDDFYKTNLKAQSTLVTNTY